MCHHKAKKDLKHRGHPTSPLICVVVTNGHVSLNALINLLFHLKEMHTIHMSGTLFQFLPNLEGIVIVHHILSYVWLYDVEDPTFDEKITMIPLLMFLGRCY